MGTSMGMARPLLLAASGAITVFGGLLMLFGGVANHSIALWILPILKQEILSHVSASVDSDAVLAIDVIAVLVSLGALNVIIGGIFLLLGSRSIGRLLVALGGAAGLIGLLLAFGYYVLVNGVTGVDAHAGYWVGFILAVSGRWLAGRA
jgi:hypothetical protein